MPRVISEQKPLRALVIGAGPAAFELHLPVLADLRRRKELELELICDLQHERAAAARSKFGFTEQTGDGIAALERSDIDVVYLFGSAQLHFEYGLAALRAGKHLFVEKPVAPTYAAAQELACTAKLHERVAVGGHNRRFLPSLTAARALAGKCGWRYAEAVFHKPEFGRPAAYGAGSWLSANGIHALDALVFMMRGLPAYVTAQIGEPSGAKPSAFSALMRWPDGAQGVFLCNNDAGGRREEYTFHGPGQTCRIDKTGLVIENSSGRTHFPPHSMDESIAAEHDAFLQSVRGGSEPPHSLANIAPSLFLCELIEQGFSGPVRLPDAKPARAPKRRASPQSILIVQPGELQQAIAQTLPGARLVSLQDVQASDRHRADVVAALLGRGAGPLPQEVLAKLPSLEIVGVVGLSVAQHDAVMLLARGITVVNAVQAYAESVAEFALGLAILGRRRAFVSHRIMQQGGWGTVPPVAGFASVAWRVGRRVRPLIRAAGLEPLLKPLWCARHAAQAHGPTILQPRELRGASVGLIGWSANARAFAARLLPAQARVLVYTEHASDSDLTECGVIRASLGEVLAADIVSLHRGLTPETRHFLGAAELEKLKPGAVLINIARGALIDPDALLARLRRGDVFACFDTYVTEPPARNDPLRTLPNVFLTSHIAGGSSDMHAAAAREVMHKVADHLAGDVVEGISIERLRTMT